MRLESNFKRRSAPLVDVHTPAIAYGQGYGLGILLGFMEKGGGRTLHAHMTPQEAYDLGERLQRIAVEMGVTP